MDTFPDGVVIAVAGALGSGKTSLIHAAVQGTFPSACEPTLPLQRIPADKLPDNVAAVLVDTAWSLSQVR
jgi:GTPase SAR1 family protein